MGYGCKKKSPGPLGSGEVVDKLQCPVVEILGFLVAHYGNQGFYFGPVFGVVCVVTFALGLGWASAADFYYPLSRRCPPRHF